MGFLSKFTGTERIDLGDGFYVEVRKYLSSAQQDAIENALIQPKMNVVPDGKGGLRQEMVAAMDMSALSRETAAQAVVSWNLTDENDVLLPYTPIEALRNSLGRIPGDVVHQIANAVGRKEGPVDRDTFPGPGEEGNPDRA